MLSMTSSPISVRSSAIVIEVTPTPQTCFVIIPFDGYDDIYDAIARAASNVRLQASRTIDRPALSFIRDIDDMLRASRIVVAVCVRRPEETFFNANVMYELGKAHALGKPTIIIASEKPAFPFSAVPSDLADKHFINFDLSENGKGSLRNRMGRLALEIENRMRAVIQRTENSLVDPDWAPDIHVVHPRYKMCVRQEFFSSFTTIIGFSEHVHHDFLPIDNVLSELERLVVEISRSFPTPNENYINTFLTTWGAKKLEFMRANKYDPDEPVSYTSEIALHDRSSIVKKAFDNLRQMAQGNEDVQRWFAKAFDLFGYIEGDLQNYKLGYRELLQSQNNGFDHALCERRAASEVWRRLSDLSRITTILVFQSHDLLSNMLEPYI